MTQVLMPPSGLQPGQERDDYLAFLQEVGIEPASLEGDAAWKWPEEAAGQGDWTTSGDAVDNEKSLPYNGEPDTVPLTKGADHDREQQQTEAGEEEWWQWLAGIRGPGGRFGRDDTGDLRGYYEEGGPANQTFAAEEAGAAGAVGAVASPSPLLPQKDAQAPTGAGRLFVLKIRAPMTEEQKVAHWSSVENRRARWYADVDALVLKQLAHEGEDVRAALSGRSLEDGLLEIEHRMADWREEWQHLLAVVYLSVAKDFADQTMRALKEGARPGEIKAGVVDIWTDRVLDWLSKHAAQKVTWIVGSIRQAIRNELAAGVAAGESMKQIAQRIAGLYVPRIEQKRALVISRTEVIIASNLGSQIAAKQTDLDLEKHWLATRDNRTRSSHHKTDGQVRPMDQPYDVGGFHMMFPGDASLGAPAKEIIQCFPADTLVQAPPIEAAYQRWYEGEMVSVQTTLGHHLTGTPNHPVLTTRGWVALDRLTESDSLLCCASGQGVPLGQLDIQHEPAQLGEIFSALAEAWNVVRVVGLRDDFHSDGMDGNINVVRADSKLRNRLQTGLSEPGDHLLLAHAYLAKGALVGKRQLVGVGWAGGLAPGGGMRSSGQSATFFGAALGLAQQHALRAVAWSDVGQFQQAGDHIAAHAKLSSDLLDRLARTIGGQDSGGNVAMVAQLRQGDSLALRPDGGAALMDTPLGSHHRKTKGSGNLGDALAGLVQLAHVSKLRRIGFAGHVYNLQTDRGWYIASGIISHNCRCTEIYRVLE